MAAVVHQLSDAQMKRRYLAGATIRQIATEADCAPNTVWRKLVGLGVILRARGRRPGR